MCLHKPDKTQPLLPIDMFTIQNYGSPEQRQVATIPASLSHDCYRSLSYTTSRLSTLVSLWSLTSVCLKSNSHIHTAPPSRTDNCKTRLVSSGILIVSSFVSSHPPQHFAIASTIVQFAAHIGCYRSILLEYNWHHG
jgi:hypothetical protein